jgi:hypothetical protein
MRANEDGGRPELAAAIRRGGIVEPERVCLRPTCGRPVPPQSVRRGEERRYCSDRCRRAHWDELHPRQRVLDFKPGLQPAATPPHNPKLRPKLIRAARAILGLLGDGGRHSRHELEAQGGNRYAARVNELREAGHVILGPREARRLKRQDPILETEPLGKDGLEVYRLVLPCHVCGRKVERERRCYAIPTCLSCLAPPEPLPVIDEAARKR